tara:strand:- start:1496 stop:2821 length:1326 start_codon:yes stop_codon:yes gene_type:complete
MINLLTLKNNFNDIKNLRQSCINLMKSLAEKIDILKIIYDELLRNNLDETETGLDSFHFQTKLIILELQNNQHMFKIIDNRIYGDYYKLFKILINYISENIKNKNLVSQFENKDYKVYKDLNSLEDYEFSSTTEIYNDVIQIIDIFHTELTEREHKLAMQKIKQESGLNIHTLTSKVNYNNNYLKNHIMLFTDNIETFNSFHKRYLIRFLLKTKLFYGQINTDIKLEESRNSLDYKLQDNDNESIILEEDEEIEIRNSIQNTEDISGKSIQIDTKNNMQNELNSMINGVSSSSDTNSFNSPRKNGHYSPSDNLSLSDSNSNPCLEKIDENVDDNTAIIYIQNKIRCNNAKKITNNKRTERDETNAATKIQNKFRENKISKDNNSLKKENIIRLDKQVDEIIEKEENEEKSQSIYDTLLGEINDNHIIYPKSALLYRSCIIS